MMHRRLTNLCFRFSELYPARPNLASTGTSFHSKELIKNIRKDLFPLPKFQASTLPFGKYNSDHLISVDWDVQHGWSKPVLQPFEDLKLHPFSSALHYGIQCFQGLKAYRNSQGEIRLFRPQANAARLKRSSHRLTLPDFDGEELINLISELVKVQERWIPPFSEFSLYVRPLHIGVDTALGVKNPDKAKMLIMSGPVGPYYPTGFKPISLSCATDTIRSAHKGTGAFKLGGNYAPTLLTAVNVSAHGHQQALWLLDDQVIEVGASNIFFVFKDNKSGEIQVATPELEDLILPGVTRDSILEVLRDQKEYKISQRKIMIQQVVQRQQRGELLECFGAGTAVIVSGVKNIEYKGVDYKVPVDEKLHIGPISYKVRQTILDIQQGRQADKYGWVRRVK